MAPQQKAAGAATPATAQEINQHEQSTADRDTERKAIATIRAQFALRGFAVHDSSAGGWLVSQWGLTRHCSGIDELRALLCLVGGIA